jgi:coenzyme F420-reducing hydrogenase delta subunit
LELQDFAGFGVFDGQKISMEGLSSKTLQRLALEPERIKVVELSHDQFDRVPLVLDEFASELNDLGPNPLKGF